MNFWFNVFLILGIYLLAWSFFFRKVPAFGMPSLKVAAQALITILILTIFAIKGDAYDTSFDHVNYGLIFTLILVLLVDLVLKDKPKKSD